MEMMSDNVDSTMYQQADALSQAREIVEENRKTRLEREQEADQAIAQKEIEELRKKINNRQ
jgi:regulator of replication initiation timing